VSAVAKDLREPACSIAIALVIDASALRSKVLKTLPAIEGQFVVDDPDSADVTITDRMLDTDTPTIFIGRRRQIQTAMQEGFAGGLLASFSAAQLRIAVEAAVHGLTCMSARRMGAGLGAPYAGEETDREEMGFDLTAREGDVLALLMTGASNKQIARQLQISIHTVKFHVASIISKLGASGRTDAVARALVRGQAMI
jgi:DNA-binding NarL/FixJ family response regulator